MARSAASFPLDPAVKQPLTRCQLWPEGGGEGEGVRAATLANNWPFVGIGRNNSDNCSGRFADVGKQIAIVYYAQEFFLNMFHALNFHLLHNYTQLYSERDLNLYRIACD